MDRNIPGLRQNDGFVCVAVRGARFGAHPLSLRIDSPDFGALLLQASEEVEGIS